MRNGGNRAGEIRVALVWHAFGHANLGVDALSRANASIVEAAAARVGCDVRLVTIDFGQKPYVDDLPSTVEIGPEPSLKQILQGQSRFLSVLRSCDLAIDIGEGDSFTDIYGLRRFITLTGSKVASLFFGHPLILAPQTIGPFDNRLRRWIAARVLDRAAAVYTRDRLSTEFVASLGATGPRDEFIDVAFRLPFTRRAKANDRIRIGINVSGLLYHGGYTGGNELGMSLDYAALTERLATYFLSLEGVEVHLFAHVAGGGGRDDDAPAIADLAARLPGVEVAPVFASSVHAKSWMSGLDFVVAGRMHACIGAYSAGVPVAPIAYSRKFNGLFKTLDYPYFIDGKVTATAEAFAKITRWFERRDELAAAIEASRSLIDERLQHYEDSIAAHLASVMRRRS
ncbi:Polysaccharide pyruvyl transferase family protein WcaK [Rhodoblastus acidophilus]|uniref:Polysaccharide pyruvyl transferase family protein WcaK n=1 Tax=Rhodoblastus acidophilus TaxID=1074 RepID=A0A212Q0P5_RHOAC|nr:polysaccharide pyruvyl transferase family protein [Rhodoblastus acidophilus]SNB52794.1 Polysaccharide pyruvyl transferase family protein WcaK [Rhodoblastus acidophilus]